MVILISSSYIRNCSAICWFMDCVTIPGTHEHNTSLALSNKISMVVEHEGNENPYLKEAQYRFESCQSMEQTGLYSEIFHASRPFERYVNTAI